MPSPIPKHLRTEDEHAAIPAALRDHVVDLFPKASNGVATPGAKRHRAKYVPGLATELVRLAGTESVGDPMAGTGTLARETGIAAALNDIDPGMSQFLRPLEAQGCEVSFRPAHEIKWRRDVCIFSPPYYPRSDRRIPNAHDDAKRGRGGVIGFRDSYLHEGELPAFIGNPAGVNAIRIYRDQMREVYSHLTSVCSRMIVVTKNWTRLGVELRLDLDTILTAQETGWTCTERHGLQPKPSLWARYNATRGGGCEVEDVLIFEKPEKIR